MSDVSDRYLLRVKLTGENKYASLRNTISDVIHSQGWKVEQISFVMGSHSVNKQDLGKNLRISISGGRRRVTRRMIIKIII
jgi:hypothetical protein